LANKPSIIKSCFHKPEELPIGSKHRESFDFCYDFFKNNFDIKDLIDLIKSIKFGDPTFRYKAYQLKKIIAMEHSDEDVYFHASYTLPKSIVEEFLTCSLEELPLKLNDVKKDEYETIVNSIIFWRLKNGR